MSEEISIKKAALINFVSKYSNIFIQILYMAILARILDPDDFGVVAIITVFTTFFTLFADMGFGAALIQNKKLIKSDIENIFSFSFYLALALGLAFSIFSIPLSIIYENNVYKSLGLILSFSLFFNTLNTVPNALLLKNKKFIVVGIRSVVVNIMSSILTVILAYAGLKYYALTVNSVFTAFFTFLWNYKNMPVKFKFKFDKESIMKIKSYSGYLFGFNIINYFSRNLDNLLLGKFMGDVPLAYYDKAYRLMLYPVQNLTHVVTPVLHPILSEHQDNKKYIYDKFMLTIKVLSLLGIFVSIYCYFATDEIILIVFGEKWRNSIPCFKWLSLSIWAQMVNTTSGSIFQALGKTKLQFVRGIVVAIITITSILIGLSSGDLAKVSQWVAIAYNLHFISMLYFLIHLAFKESSIDFCKKLIPHVVIAIIMVIGMNVGNLIKIDEVFLSAIYKGMVCLAAYVVGIVITREHKLLINLVKRKKN